MNNTIIKSGSGFTVMPLIFNRVVSAMIYVHDFIKKSQPVPIIHNGILFCGDDKPKKAKCNKKIIKGVNLHTVRNREAERN